MVSETLLLAMVPVPDSVLFLSVVIHGKAGFAYFGLHGTAEREAATVIRIEGGILGR